MQAAWLAFYGWLHFADNIIIYCCVCSYELNLSVQQSGFTIMRKMKPSSDDENNVKVRNIHMVIQRKCQWLPCSLLKRSGAADGRIETQLNESIVSDWISFQLSKMICKLWPQLFELYTGQSTRIYKAETHLYQWSTQETVFICVWIKSLWLCHAEHWLPLSAFWSNLFLPFE